jgi:hypothetical protein
MCSTDKTSIYKPFPTSVISKNYLDVAHIRENTIILYLFRDYLIFYTVMYLNNNTNKIHTIASNVNV